MARYRLVSQETYQQSIQGLPLPTSLQYEQFANHLANAHSWHKHLSLRHGGHFIIFFHPSAGSIYPTQHPSLPFGNHTEGYRKAFGYLSYMYVSNAHRKLHYSRDDEDTFREGEVVVQVSEEALRTSSFVLYPYISHNGFNNLFSSYLDRQQDLKALLNNEYSLPDHALFLKFMHTNQQVKTVLDNLNEEEYQVYLNCTGQQAIEEYLQYPKLQTLTELEQSVKNAYQQLQQNEHQKIIWTLKNLKKCLEGLLGS